jgi:hypothetical protein
VARRDQIQMTADEARAFLAQERVVTCATLGPRGWPHLMPLWYVVRGDDVWAWTYAASQKARNLERDARATLQVETGDSYDQLRGVMLECDTVVHRELDDVAGVGMEISRKYAGDPLTDMVMAQAPKRVALQFVERRRATWDHRKLAGTY